MLRFTIYKKGNVCQRVISKVAFNNITSDTYSKTFLQLLPKSKISLKATVDIGTYFVFSLLFPPLMRYDCLRHIGNRLSHQLILNFTPINPPPKSVFQKKKTNKQTTELSIQ